MPEQAVNEKMPLLLHVMLMLAVPIYFVVYQFVLLPAHPPRPGSATMPVFGVFLFLGISQIGLALMLPRLVPGMCPQEADSPAQRLRKRTVAAVVRAALLESIALFGLIGLYVNLLPWMSYLLMGLSLVAMAAFLPRLIHGANDLN